MYASKRSQGSPHQCHWTWPPKIQTNNFCLNCLIVGRSSCSRLGLGRIALTHCTHVNWYKLRMHLEACILFLNMWSASNMTRPSFLKLARRILSVDSLLYNSQLLQFLKLPAVRLASARGLTEQRWYRCCALPIDWRKSVEDDEELLVATLALGQC